MKRLEIIHLRSSGAPVDSLSDQISTSLKATPRTAENVALYRREGLETDIAIHIHHGEGRGTAGPNGLGLRLASALKAYGLVEHSVWVERDETADEDT
jgi:hypothetical protein